MNAIKKFTQRERINYRKTYW